MRASRRSHQACGDARKWLTAAFPVPIGYGVGVRISSRAPAVSSPESVSWDEVTWPVVRITLRDGKDERFLWLLQRFESLFLRQQRYVLLIDTMALSTIPSGGTRHAVGKWQSAHTDETRKWCVGSAILISSRLVRGALTAMNWVHEPVVPHHYPATRREALDWCIGAVDEAGLELTARARKILQSADG
jgi:hypothetical protein